MAKPIGEVVGYCPKCNKAIGDQNPYGWCIECGEPLPSEIKAKILPLIEIERQEIEKQRQAEQSKGDNFPKIDDDHAGKSPGEKSVLNRYLDLYRNARLMVTIGNAVKVIGIIVGCGILLVSLVEVFASGVLPVAIIVAVYGILIGGFIALIGIIIAGLGQILLAQTDSAVHTSPLMTDEEKTQVMSL